MQVTYAMQVRWWLASKAALCARHSSHHAHASHHRGALLVELNFSMPLVALEELLTVAGIFDETSMQAHTFMDLETQVADERTTDTQPATSASASAQNAMAQNAVSAMLEYGALSHRPCVACVCRAVHRPSSTRAMTSLPPCGR